MVNRLLAIVSIATIILASSCTGTPMRPQEVPQQVAITSHSLSTNFRTIQTIMPHLDDLDAQFADLPRPGEHGRDYFNAQETDRIESLLFSFLAMQTALWDIVDSYGGLNADYPADEIDTKAHVLSITATLLMASHTAFIVGQFADQPIAIKQLNEAYFRSEIPFGSYDRMRVNVTAPDLLHSISKTKELYKEEMQDPRSVLASLSNKDAGYASLIRQIPALLEKAETRLQLALKYDPSQADAKKIARKDAEKQHKTLYAIRSFLFKDVSRLKNPSAHVIVFSDVQKKEIFNLLEPGDLILTFTAGYMSDVFIPGAFKHGITYIGTSDEREAIALTANSLPPNERFDMQEVEKNLQQSSLPDGTQADMIEAVAEGVIFNNLEHIMDTHVNRMLVLRPRLSKAERAAFLLEVYSYLGDGYDFRFDFADASQQVCTEVIYRAINGKGGINFTLTERAGHETLSADDIANYHLSSKAFDFVLLVETKPDSKNNEALIFVGTEGESRIKQLMNTTK